MGIFGSVDSIGLAIEPDRIKAVAVETVRGAVTITRFAETALSVAPDDDGYREALGSTIRELFDSHSLSRENVTVTFNSADAILRQVSLPFSDEVRLRKTIKFEIEDALPMPVDGYVVDYHVGRTVDGKTLVLVAAVAREHMRALLGALEAHGIDAVAVELDVAGLANVAGWSGRLTDRSIIADIGRQTTKTVICEDGDVVFWRTFRTRGSDAAATAAKIYSELKRSVLSADLAGELQSLLVSGSHPELPAIRQALSEKMGIPASSLGPTSGEGAAGDVSLEKVVVSGAAALGCALKGVGFNVSSIDLRREEFAYKRKFEKLTSGLLTLASILLVCGLLWNMRTSRILSLASGDDGRIYANAVRMWNSAGVDDPCPATTKEVAMDLEARVRSLKTGAADVRKTVKRSVLDEWKAWAEQISTDLDVVISEIRMGPREITVIGTTTSAAEAEELRASVNRSGRFSFTLPVTRPAKGGRTRFTIKHEYED